MSQSIETMSAPVLRQSVRFGERYVSSALNRKLAGILSPGVYRGFVVKPGGAGKVLVTHEDGSSRSVAVVERDGYSLTVTMDDPGYVEIPASGTWHIVIEAFYVETQPGYQRIVAREKLNDHHILLATVTVEDISSDITDDMINVDRRDVAESVQIFGFVQHSLIREARATASRIRLIRNSILESLARIDLKNDVEFAKMQEMLRFVHTAKHNIILMRRIASVELALAMGIGNSVIPVFTETLSPAGYTAVGGAKIAPISIVDNKSVAPEDAALIVNITHID
ncbi:MAG: hypothetical protein E7022_03235 [Desulfovibrio desulfuricans]|nr:hypothetical protein [Desulfovibrio desulfuricans]